jgi:squalene-hopene/tetraprenyl-beta-curcumene cyclase
VAASLAVPLLAILSLAGCSSASRATWNAQAAAAYLDHREDWWMHWRGAARDHGTFCVSCHSSLPYALARPRLDTVLHAQAPASVEAALTSDVIKRVRLWSQTQPYYTDSRNGPHKSSQSRGTEAVLDALILATDDARTGQLSADTLAAFGDMWALQETTGANAGAWPWLNFGLEPWEVKDAGYYGAAMAALAVGVAPQDYRSTPAIQASLGRLRDYLSREYGAQPLHQRLALLWAASALPGLISPAERQSIIDAALHAQHSDGGWSLYDLSPSYRRGRRLFELWSDGYATAYVTFVLQQAGVPRTSPALEKGLAWLRSHQRLPQGRWATASINEWHSSANPESDFMSDAATAYAVLSLTDAAATGTAATGRQARASGAREPMLAREARR